MTSLRGARILWYIVDEGFSTDWLSRINHGAVVCNEWGDLWMEQRIESPWRRTGLPFAAKLRDFNDFKHAVALLTEKYGGMTYRDDRGQLRQKVKQGWTYRGNTIYMRSWDDLKAVLLHRFLAEES